MKRFAFRATFFFCFFGATAGFVRTEHVNGGQLSFLTVLGVLTFYALFALMQASWVERDAVASKNARLLEEHDRAVKLTQEQYEVDLKAAQEAQPIRMLERKRPDGELEAVRAPLKAPRPLLDTTLGKTSNRR